MTIHALPHRTIEYNGKTFLFFSGVSYLGVGQQADFKSILWDAFEQYGTIFSASRHNALQLGIYKYVEQFIAQQAGAEDALTVSSGMLAGQLMMHILKSQKCIVAPKTHPAIHLPSLCSFENRQDFENNILLKVKQYEANIIVSDAIDPLYCTPYQWDWVAQLPNDRPLTLLLDDSHGIGITGEKGWGIFTILNNIIKKHKLYNIDILVIASMSKALGIPAGIILGSHSTLEKIWKSPHFAGASPAVPAYLKAFLSYQTQYKGLHDKLLENIELFNQLLEQFQLKSFFHTLTNYPIFYTPQDAFAAALLQQNILISSFPYPHPNSKPITRIVLSALHTREDIIRLAECCKQSAI